MSSVLVLQHREEQLYRLFDKMQVVLFLCRLSVVDRLRRLLLLWSQSEIAFGLLLMLVRSPKREQFTVVLARRSC